VEGESPGEPWQYGALRLAPSPQFRLPCARHFLQAAFFMPDPGDWQFAIDIHPEGWRFPAGQSWIAGWLHSGSGRAAADVRAWIDDRPFLGLCGLPRPEIERQFPGGDGPPHAGFSFLLAPHRSARRLRIEVCDETGAWEEIHRQDISVAPDVPAAAAEPALGRRIGDLLVTLLRMRQARPGEPWPRLADAVLAAHRAIPLDTLPNPPFHGALEEPTAAGRVKYGRLTVTGWLAHRERTIVRLTAFTDPRQPMPLLHGRPRRDVEGLFAGLRDGENSAFFGQVDVPAGYPLPASLRIFAELDDGRRELVFNRRFHPRDVAGATGALPPWSATTFFRAATALHLAARRHHLTSGAWRDRIAALRAAWETYRAEAPGDPWTPSSVHIGMAPAVRRPLKVVLVTHNLNLEGAPLFALEYARYLAAQPGWQVRIVSPQDGPLRADFERAGLPVELVDVRPLTSVPTPADFDRAVAAFAAGAAWAEADLIVANTLLAFWAVPLARREGKPSLLYIHESAPVRRFFGPLLAPALIPRAEAALGQAGAVAFIAAATRTVHARLERRGNFRLLPSWIDTAAIAQFAADHDRAELRRRHGVAADAVVFANIGSVCERKGQHVFVRAVALLERELAAAGGTFPPREYLMVGARPGAYLDSLRQEIALRGLANVRLVDETPAVYDFYHLSDIGVCSSFEESFPRVLMEAAAFGRPIVSTNVNGVIELLGPDDAWLVPPGDAPGLARALRAALDAARAGDRRRPERAARIVEEKHSAAQVLPLHAALAAETAARGPR